MREVKNEAELLSIAANFGIAQYDFASVTDEADSFHSACCIAGAPGAGLANLAHCAPGTKVLEPIPSDHVHPHVNTLADAARLDYACPVGNSLSSQPKSDLGQSPQNFRVDPDLVHLAPKSFNKT